MPISRISAIRNLASIHFTQFGSVVVAPICKSSRISVVSISEAPPQTDELRRNKLRYLSEAMLVAGCSILDKEKKNCSF